MWKDLFTLKGRWNRLNRLRFFEYGFILPAIMVILGILMTIIIATISGYQNAAGQSSSVFGSVSAQLINSKNNPIVKNNPSEVKIHNKINTFLLSFGVLGVNIVFIVLLLWTSICLGVKRLHDIGWNGWLILLNFIPIINIFMSIILLFRSGNIGKNKYGPDPLELDAIAYLEKVKSLNS